MYDLTIQEIGLPPITLKKAHQKLSLISSDQLLRTVNGDLVTLGNSCKKYRLEAWGETLDTPELRRLTKGQDVEVHLPQRVFQSIMESRVTLEHRAVPSSILVMGLKKEPIPFEVIDDRTIGVEDTLTNGDFTVSYLPIFQMKVLDLSYETSSEGFEFKWRLVLEEI